METSHFFTNLPFPHPTTRNASVWANRSRCRSRFSSLPTGCRRQFRCRLGPPSSTSGACRRRARCGTIRALPSKFPTSCVRAYAQQQSPTQPLSAHRRKRRQVASLPVVNASVSAPAGDLDGVVRPLRTLVHVDPALVGFKRTGVDVAADRATGKDLRFHLLLAGD